MNNLTKESLKTLRADMDAALASVGAKHGVRFRLGSCTFWPTTAKFKLELATVGDNGVVVDKDMETLRRYTDILGLSMKDLEKTFKLWDGRSYKLAGYVPRRYSRPFVLVDAVSGRRVVAPKDAVLKALGAEDLGPNFRLSLT